MAKKREKQTVTAKISPENRSWIRALIGNLWPYSISTSMTVDVLITYLRIKSISGEIDLSPAALQEVMTTENISKSRNMSTAERFWINVQKTDSCWLWRGFRKKDGYGMFKASSASPINAHRFAYEDRFGPIPDGYEIDHLCRNTSCVNPDHLEAVLRRSNRDRAKHKAVSA